MNDPSDRSKVQEVIDHEMRHVQQCFAWGPIAEEEGPFRCADFVCREVNAYALTCRYERDTITCIKDGVKRSLAPPEKKVGTYGFGKRCWAEIDMYINEAIQSGCMEKSVE